jgi:hypothetical protein
VTVVSARFSPRIFCAETRILTGRRNTELKRKGRSWLVKWGSAVQRPSPAPMRARALFPCSLYTRSILFLSGPVLLIFARCSAHPIQPVLLCYRGRNTTWCFFLWYYVTIVTARINNHCIATKMILAGVVLVCFIPFVARLPFSTSTSDLEQSLAPLTDQEQKEKAKWVF